MTGDYTKIIHPSLSTPIWAEAFTMEPIRVPGKSRVKEYWQVVNDEHVQRVRYNNRILNAFYTSLAVQIETKRKVQNVKV